MINQTFKQVPSRDEEAHVVLVVDSETNEPTLIYVHHEGCNTFHGMASINEFVMELGTQAADYPGVKELAAAIQAELL
jgi:hypothetical protein